jgi:hypothetical protein
MVPASWAFAAFLTGNSAFHLLMSAGRGELVTGAITSPLMLVAGLFLFVSAARGRQEATSEGA